MPSRHLLGSILVRNVDQIYTGKCAFIVKTQTIRIQVITRLPATRKHSRRGDPPPCTNRIEAQQFYFTEWSVHDLWADICDARLVGCEVWQIRTITLSQTNEKQNNSNSKKNKQTKVPCPSFPHRETSILVNDDHCTQLNNSKITGTLENNATVCYKNVHTTLRRWWLKRRYKVPWLYNKVCFLLLNLSNTCARGWLMATAQLSENLHWGKRFIQNKTELATSWL